MRFEWDPAKAKSNFRKHGVSFREAATAFGDPLAWTFPDRDHSETEERMLTIGTSELGTVLVLAHTEGRVRLVSSARVRQHHENGDLMKKHTKQDDLRDEYDFSKMPRGVRGKYVEACRAGTNIALLADDVASAFPTDDAVNRALRVIIDAAHAMPATAKPSNGAAHRPAQKRRR